MTFEDRVLSPLAFSEGAPLALQEERVPVEIETGGGAAAALCRG